MRRVQLRFVPLVLICVLATAATVSVHGDVTINYTDPDHFNWSVSHVPDLDQNRAGLPLNGSWHCVPTAATDWLAYFANHGPAWLAPGPGNYQSQAMQGTATAAILNLAGMMGTQSPGGTGADDLELGLAQALPPTLFSTSHILMTHSFTPGFDTLAFCVFSGGYPMVGLGFYEYDGSTITRRNGHLVACSAGIVSDPSYGVAFRDPWTLDSIFSQSTFTDDWYAIAQDVVTPDWATGARPMWRTDGYTKNNGEWQGYIDEVHAIFPTFALIDTDDLDLTPGFVQNPTVGGGVTPASTYPPPAGRAVVDMTLHADLTCAVLILEKITTGAREIWTLRPHDGGQWTNLGIGIFQPSALLVGRHRELFVLDGLGSINKIDIDVDPPVFETSMSTPVPGEALAYDDENDLLLVYSADDGTLMEMDHALQTPATTWNLPGVPFSSDACVTWNPETGDRFVCVEGQVYRMSYGGDTFEQITFGDGVAPCMIDFGDGGRMYAIADGEIKEYELVGSEWCYPPDPAFPGHPAGTVIHVSRTSSNFDPAVHTGVGWENTDLEPGDQGGNAVPDCTADIDGDGVVGVVDLLALLAAWGTSDPFADVNADLTVSVQDLLALLAAWGPCPEGGLP